MELPTWKGPYCPHHVNPLSVKLFNHAWVALYLDNTKQTQEQYLIYYLCSFHETTCLKGGILYAEFQPFSVRLLSFAQGVGASAAVIGIKFLYAT